MKRVTLTLLMLLIPTMLLGQDFILEDGIVKCEGVEIGTTGTIFGEVYEAVDRELLIQRRDEGADLTKVCVSNVTDMSYMFFLTQFNQPIDNWDVSNVTDMEGMFGESQFNQPIGNWDVSNVTNMTYMFWTSIFNQPIGDWDVSNVTDMVSMFGESQFNQPIGDWDVSNVTDMGYLFQNSQFNQPIGNWDVSNVTDMFGIFSYSQFNQPIGDWDVSNVTNMAYMFPQSQFNQPIGDWDVSNVTNMTYMFSSSQFNQPIENWDVSNVSNMIGMFQFSNYNQPIGNWDVSNVTDMSYMFSNSQFNQPINGWCVSQIPSEPTGFSSNSPLTEENKPVWGTCPILNKIPSTPLKLLPEENGNDISSTPQFSWTTDSLATTYRLQVTQELYPLVIDTLVTDSVFTSPLTLIRNTDHYWRVMAINENVTVEGEFLKSEWSSVWKFTTDSTGINPPIYIDPDGIVRCEGEEIGLTWIIEGVSYEVVDRELLIQRRDEGADLSKVCVSNVTDMNNMFYQLFEFNQPIGNWDVSSVTDMSRMFFFSFSFNQPIGNWDVSNVTDMSEMFVNSTFNQPIGDWDVSNVTDMSLMFVGSQFNQPIGNWDVSNVTNMFEMFDMSNFNQPIENWDVSSVTDMSVMFGHSQFNQPIGNWDVSNVTDMSLMFGGSPFNQPIGDWDVSNVTSMSSMFSNTPFNQPIENWDVSNVSDMSGMFSNSQFNQPIGDWDVSNVTDMSFMFYQSQFNQPIGNWDVSNVIQMSKMFKNSQFNQPINEWCVTQFPSEPNEFSTNSTLTEENKPIWGTCPATNSQSFNESWNLVSVPVEMEDYSYSALFPNSTEGTLYSFGDGYILEETLTPLKGYWINLTEGDSTTFSGERLFPTTLTLQSEWNLIGSVSEQTSLSDPNEIIIPGTLYGFNNGYFPTEIIESGRGYWINTLSEGDVELVRYEPTETTLFLKQPLRSPSVLSKFDEIQFFHQDKLRTELYFNGEFGVDVHPLQTKLPPIPPKGSFDVRTENGEWITEQSQIRIRIQQTDSPVEMVLNGEHLYRIEFLTDEKQPIGEYRIVDNSESIPIPTSSQWMDIQLYEIEQTDIPIHFTLSQNYPNPFNPSTQIEFSLPESVPVELSVYTITGQLVSTLVNEPLSVGTHSVSFDGSSYPSGVYLYRLQTPSFTQSKLMNLIK